jgi:hypothetical protein
MVYPQPPKRGANPVRILVWIIAGIILGVAVCCGGLFLAATVSPSLYR